MSESVSPENCPTPEYHESHRYCPSCTYREPVASDIDRAIVATFYKQSDWTRVLDAIESYEMSLSLISDDVRRREHLPPYGPWPRAALAPETGGDDE